MLKGDLCPFFLDFHGVLNGVNVFLEGFVDLCNGSLI
jgi:hypothetical protein